MPQRVQGLLLGTIGLAVVACVEQPDRGAATWGSALTSTGVMSTDTDTDDSPDEPATETTTGEPDTIPTTGGSSGGVDVDALADVVDGSSGTGDDSGESTGSTGADDGPPGFAADIWPIVFPECGCHMEQNPAGELHLGKMTAYDNLVGEHSQQLKKMLLVDPGSPDTSYLWHKLQDTHESVDGEGKMMPPGGKLAPEELELFKAWIEQGALP